MTKPDCEICRGSGAIRLPIYRTLISDYNINAPPAIMESSIRDYPCPECSERVPQEHVAIVQCRSYLNTMIDDSAYMRTVKNVAIREIAEHLNKNGFIRFERDPQDIYDLKTSIRATVGVVSTAHVATIQERSAKHQEEFAREVIAEASRQIRVWSSDYTGDEGPIRKRHAVDCLDDALKAVLAKRSAWRVL